MSACIMMQRLNNPLVAQSTQHSYHKFPSNASSNLIKENVRDGKRMEKNIIY
jgi:hypothetical protein